MEDSAALREYTTVKDGYTQLLRSAVYKTGTERTDALKALENQNHRLQEAVRRLLIMYESGKDKLESEYSQYTVDGLRKDLEKYKKDLAELQNGRDELTRLQTIYGSTQADAVSQRYTYFAYIIAVLVLLVIDFALFVGLSLSSWSSPIASPASPGIFETPDFTV